ncbi:hypothetical protein ACQP2E_16465 [Actinoplanes sp. CA-015351]|uniref:hypothetical protein n=1 Tax=Actinoplanes sp. CA-015351 TaxID=3239897 RepID=UPI003D9720EF
MAANSGRLFAVAAVLFGLSGFLLYTLVLGEPYLEPDSNAVVEQAVAIGLPALAGVLVAALAFRRARRQS